MLRHTPVVILAGGLGTRLRPVLTDRPKALASVGDRPFLQVQIELLRDQGATYFVLCVGHLADSIRAAFGDGSALGVRIAYSLESGTLLGTGGALKQAQRFFQPRALVLNGDTYLAIDYNRLLRHHEESRVMATLALSRADDGHRFGNVQVDAAGRRVLAFREKETAGIGPQWVNAGVYAIERRLLDPVPPGRQVSLEHAVFPGALAAGQPIAAFQCREMFHDIGTPEAWQRFVARFQPLAA